MHEKAEENYVNIVLINNCSLESKEMYAGFCLKNRKFDQAFVLYQEIVNMSGDFSHKLYLSALLIQRRRTS